MLLGLGDITDWQRGDYNLQLSHWRGTIIGPQNTRLGEKFYEIEIFCGPLYPEQPPEVTFKTKINMKEVDPITGKVFFNDLLASSIL